MHQDSRHSHETDGAVHSSQVVDTAKICATHQERKKIDLKILLFLKSKDILEVFKNYLKFVKVPIKFSKTIHENEWH